MDSVSSPPSDLVALFHATFHPTKGNIIDWSEKLELSDLNLDGVEFSSLPSGLHLVEEDVIYFTCQEYQGVCIFRRRTTSDHGERGARLGALGAIVAKSSRPRPWCHLPNLKVMSDRLEEDPTRRDFLSEYFDQHKSSTGETIVEPELWNGWSHELHRFSNHPLLRLPQLLRLLGPVSITFIKHILAHKRVMIYTHPSAELACQLAMAGMEICFGEEGTAPSSAPTVLGMVGLIDMSRLEKESSTGSGWVACTTDRLFLERPHVYDLLLDLTTPNPTTSFPAPRAVRPSLAISRRIPSTSSRNAARLTPVKYTFSDLKLWGHIEKLLDQLESSTTIDEQMEPTPDLYEGLCMLCLGIWGNTIGRPSGGGAIRMDGFDDVLTHINSTTKEPEPSPGMELGATSTHSTLVGASSSTSTVPLVPSSSSPSSSSVDATILLLSTLQAQVSLWNTCLASLLSSRAPEPSSQRGRVVLGLRDVAAMDLNPLSDMDCRFFSGFAKSKLRGREVVVRKGWKDLFGLLWAW